MNGRLIGVILILLLAFSSCSDNEAYHVKTNSNVENRPYDEVKLIKKGELSFEVEAVNQSQKYVLNQVKKYKAYISSDRTYHRENGLYNDMEIRVPQVFFDTLIAEIIEGVKVLDEQFVEVEDVTSVYIDVEARLKTKKALELRFLTLLNQASSLTEILEVEAVLSEVRNEIELIEGQFKVINDQINYATITLKMYEPMNIGLGEELVESIKLGCDNLYGFFILLVSIWPFMLIGLGAYFLLKKKR